MALGALIMGVPMAALIASPLIHKPKLQQPERPAAVHKNCSGVKLDLQ
jgi:hypothetical protein